MAAALRGKLRGWDGKREKLMERVKERVWERETDLAPCTQHFHWLSTTELMSLTLKSLPTFLSSIYISGKFSRLEPETVLLNCLRTKISITVMWLLLEWHSCWVWEDLMQMKTKCFLCYSISKHVRISPCIMLNWRITRWVDRQISKLESGWLWRKLWIKITSYT